MGKTTAVNKTLVELLAAETEQDVYNAVVDGVRSFNPEAFVVVSTLLPDGDSVRAVASAGLDGRIGQVARLLGADPMAVEYSLSDMPAEDRRGLSERPAVAAPGGPLRPDARQGTEGRVRGRRAAPGYR